MQGLRDFCYTASQRVMTGLAQELKVVPFRQVNGTVIGHYRPQGYNASRVLSLRLVGVNPHYLKQIKAMKADLTMWAGLPDEYKVRVGHDAHAVIIEIPKPKGYWKRVTIEDLTRRRFIHRGPVATVGLGLQDDPKRINFNDEAMAHVLISGATRSGKTNAEQLVAWNLAHNTTPADSKMVILDVAKKGFRWKSFARVAHLAHPLVTTVPEAEGVLGWASREIDRRAEQGYTAPATYLFVDELKALADDSPVAVDYMSRIAGVGGEFGLHLILATQYPQIKMLGSAELKRNVTTRLCGRVDDASAAANALGLPDTGAEALGGYGDFLLRDEHGLSRLTVAHIQAQHIEALDRVEAVGRLDLPDTDQVNNGPTRPTRQPKPVEPEQVALALCEPGYGINRLQKELAVGGSKATRIKRFAEGIRGWALEHGYKSVQFAEV